MFVVISMEIGIIPMSKHSSHLKPHARAVAGYRSAKGGFRRSPGRMRAESVVGTGSMGTQLNGYLVLQQIHNLNTS